mgnify:CR=1 FL=1
MSKEYDLIVLGAGNAGFAPAGMAKEAGQSVLAGYRKLGIWRHLCAPRLCAKESLGGSGRNT